MEYDAQSGHQLVRVHVERDPPLVLGVILGDFLHNLRSALDHLIWQLVILSGSEPGRWSSFPIYDDPDDFRERVEVPRAKGKKSPLLGLGDKTVSAIEQLQPYHRPDPGMVHGLWVLSVLSNIDKHQLVHVGLATLSDQEPAFSGSGYYAIHVMWRGNVTVKDGAELGYVSVLGAPNEAVKVKGTLPIDIRFGEMQIPLSKLNQLRNATVAALNVFTQGVRYIGPSS